MYRLQSADGKARGANRRHRWREGGGWSGSHVVLVHHSRVVKRLPELVNTHHGKAAQANNGQHNPACSMLRCLRCAIKQVGPTDPVDLVTLCSNLLSRMLQ